MTILVIVAGSVVGMISVLVWSCLRVSQRADEAASVPPGDWCMKRVASEAEYQTWRRRADA